MKEINDMLNMEAVKDERGNVIGFNMTVLDYSWNPIYKGYISLKEYGNLIGGGVKYVSITSER